MVARKSLFTNLYANRFDKSANSDAKKEIAIEEIKKFFESVFGANDLSLSIYEFREIFDRYVGLSLEIQNEDEELSSETEIFRITNHTNKKLAEICLHRRNRKRLSFHQKLARRDFFEILNNFADKTKAPQNLFEKVSKLAVLLDDSETQKTIENISKESLQTLEKQHVRNLENELWNSEKQKPLTEHKISTNLQVLTTTAAATANLSNKD